MSPQDMHFTPYDTLEMIIRESNVKTSATDHDFLHGIPSERTFGTSSPTRLPLLIQYQFPRLSQSNIAPLLNQNSDRILNVFGGSNPSPSYQNKKSHQDGDWDEVYSPRNVLKVIMDLYQNNDKLSASINDDWTCHLKRFVDLCLE